MSCAWLSLPISLYFSLRNSCHTGSIDVIMRSAGAIAFLYSIQSRTFGVSSGSQSGLS